MKILRFMLLGLLLITMPPWVRADPSPAAPTAQFADHYGGYLVSAEFIVDSASHAFISPPQVARAGDLLWIRPQRLNNDEYLILQKCLGADCTHAQVVRAWNAGGLMGPYPILSNKVRIEKDQRYLLWMQHVPTLGAATFPLFIRESPPLVFIPAGPAATFYAADLKRARQHGPSQITKSAKKGSAFVAIFDGGSAVRMQLLRPET